MLGGDRIEGTRGQGQERTASGLKTRLMSETEGKESNSRSGVRESMRPEWMCTSKKERKIGLPESQKVPRGSKAG